MSQPFPIPRELRKTSVLVTSGANRRYGPFPFKIFDIADVKVYAKLAGAATFTPVAADVAKVSELPQDFFNIDLPAGLASGTPFVVTGERLHERSAGVVSGTKLSITALEKELSKQGIVLQELRRDIGRAILNTFDGQTVSIEVLLDMLGQVARLRSAAFEEKSAFATSAQGALADTALQPGDELSELSGIDHALTAFAFRHGLFNHREPYPFEVAPGSSTVTIPDDGQSIEVQDVFINGIRAPDWSVDGRVVTFEMITDEAVPAGETTASVVVIVIQDFDIYDGGVVDGYDPIVFDTYDGGALV